MPAESHIYLFLTLGIALVYTREVSDGFILAFLLIAAVAKFCASVYAQSKYLYLEDRIKKLENKRKDK